MVAQLKSLAKSHATSTRLHFENYTVHAMRHAFRLTPDSPHLRGFALTVALCATIAGCGGEEPAATSPDAGAAPGTSEQQAGFTPPIRALIQFPQVVDMMCQDLDWTSGLWGRHVGQ